MFDKDLEKLKQQRKAFQGIVDAYDRAITLSERELAGEEISDEETNGAIGQLTIAYGVLASLE